jgi:hypothetical protein
VTVIFEAIDQLGIVALRQFVEAIIQVRDGVTRIRQLNIEDDLVGKQHRHCPV